MYWTYFFPLGRKKVTWDMIERASGRRGDVVRKAVNRANEKGATPSAAIVEALTNALPLIHDEVPLHSYGVGLLHQAVALRQQEDALIDRIDALKPVTAQGVQAVWATAQHRLCDPLSSMALADLRVQVAAYADGMPLPEDGRTALYLATQRLHALIVIWTKAAKAMISAGVTGDDALLTPSEALDLGDTIVDVAQLVLGLYEVVDGDLFDEHQAIQGWFKRNVRPDIRDDLAALCQVYKNAPDETGAAGRSKFDTIDEQWYLRDLLRQDRAIIGLNASGVVSHMTEWVEGGLRFATLIGLPPERLDVVTAPARGGNANWVKLAEPLMQRFPEHALIMRNLAFMALQSGEAKVAVASRDRLAKLLKLSPDEVWTTNIWGRPTLVSAIPQAFENDLPKLLIDKDKTS
jgi:hypothetical protein